ncbi:hypothetical protein [Streptomyces sp. NPDC127197]|uniref:hypothetical protein n=1 Tax=Streptomyces sp. NPDC127197 TaxID=3345388 RepID=UPI003636CABD
MGSTPEPAVPATAAEPDADQKRLTPGVKGIGSASFLADVGHEIPTALLLAAPARASMGNLGASGFRHSG